MLGAYKKLPAERLYLAVLEYFLDEEAKKAVLDDFISFAKGMSELFAAF